MYRPALAFAPALALLTAACSSANDPGSTGGNGGGGGASTSSMNASGGAGGSGAAGGGGTAGGPSTGGGGSGGSGGGTDVLPPMPIISRGVPAFASSGNAGDANDADYETMWRSSETPSAGTPAWLAYDLSKVAAKKRGKVDVAMYAVGGGYADYDLFAKPGTVTYNEPRDYTIESNAAAGGAQSAPANGWKTLATISGNTFTSRQTSVDLAGANWIRVHVTAVNGTDQNENAAMNVDVHDASAGLEDSWLFLGDSITSFASRNDGAGIGAKSFAELVHAGNAKYFPAAEGAGEGGWNSGTALETMGPDGSSSLFESWIKAFPGHFVGLSYGTNDGANQGNGGQPTSDNFETMIQIVEAHGKVACIPHVPWAQDGDHQMVAQLINAKIDALYVKYPKVVKGPDLYAVLEGHAEWFQDDLHPNPDGREAYRKAWADAVLGNVYR